MFLRRNIMSKFLRSFSITLCLLLAVSMLAGCGKTTAGSGNNNSSGASASSGEPVQTEKKEKISIEWTVWGNPGENKKFEDFTSDFNKKHEADINLKYTPIPNDGYSQKLLSSLAAGTAPDVFYLGDDITTYIKENRLVDLAPMMAASQTIQPDKFALNIFGAGKQGDKIWGIVPDCNPLVVYYNADMINSLGEKNPQQYLDEGNWNWDAFASIAKKVAATGMHGFVFSSTWWGPQAFYLGQAGEGIVFNAEGTKVDLDNPDKTEGVKFMYALSKEKAVTSTVQLPKGQDEISLFISQQAAMMTLGRWAVPVLKDIKDFKWDIVPFPKTTSGKEVKSSVAIAYVAMNKDSKHSKEAFIFMEEFLNKDGQIYRLKDGGNALPSLIDPELSSIAEDGIVGHGKYFSELRNNGLGVPIGGQLCPEAGTAVYDTLGQMYLGKIDADTCIKQALEKGDAQLAKNSN